MLPVVPPTHTALVLVPQTIWTLHIVTDNKGSLKLGDLVSQFAYRLLCLLTVLSHRLLVLVVCTEQPLSATSNSSPTTASSSDMVTDRQFAVICSEKQARVWRPPSFPVLCWLCMSVCPSVMQMSPVKMMALLLLDYDLQLYILVQLPEQNVLHLRFSIFC